MTKARRDTSRAGFAELGHGTAHPVAVRLTALARRRLDAAAVAAGKSKSVLLREIVEHGLATIQKDPSK